MIAEQLIFGLLGAALFGLGLRTALTPAPLIRRVLAINVAGGGVFLFMHLSKEPELPSPKKVERAGEEGAKKAAAEEPKKTQSLPIVTWSE